MDSSSAAAAGPRRLGTIVGPDYDPGDGGTSMATVKELLLRLLDVVRTFLASRTFAVAERVSRLRRPGSPAISRRDVEDALSE